MPPFTTTKTVFGQTVVTNPGEDQEGRVLFFAVMAVLGLIAIVLFYLQYRRAQKAKRHMLTSKRRTQLFFWSSLNVVTSYIHFFDNILRPDVYWTPFWICRNYTGLGDMEVAFFYWIAHLPVGLFGLGLMLQAHPPEKMLQYGAWAMYLYSFMIWSGQQHFIVQVPWMFSLPAIASILMEGIVAVILHVYVWLAYREAKVALKAPTVEQVGGRRRVKTI
eukprot:TRINITY_DN65845_c2_g9_i1.p1 TRINITY_DN65845_c2_g9~~TRINITY_DN65845_c2_g9_i1.p1  ORF type:complete len:219 (-),score=7.29 TRINITY_DN65845_c2_g9_i1:130-786(-)